MKYRIPKPLLLCGIVLIGALALNTFMCATNETSASGSQFSHLTLMYLVAQSGFVVFDTKTGDMWQYIYYKLPGKVEYQWKIEYLGKMVKLGEPLEGGE